MEFITFIYKSHWSYVQLSLLEAAGYLCFDLIASLLVWQSSQLLEWKSRRTPARRHVKSLSFDAESKVREKDKPKFN